ncbi:MAG TPA: hypothetical protein VJT75_19315 [Thermoleophilaceae bacterium]|nr:hypothetical protein [Thermoleophilaceae bacterium]
MRQWRNGLFACLLAAAALAAGCGDDNSTDTSGGGGGGGGGGGNAPASVKDAVKQCLEQAKSINDKDARKTAEEACDAAKSGQTDKVKNAVKKQCLDAVNQIPDSAKDQKEAAKSRCEAIK